MLHSGSLAALFLLPGLADRSPAGRRITDVPGGGRQMSVRFRLCLIAWFTTVALSVLFGKAEADVYDTGDGWLIEVTPAMKVPASTEVIVRTDPAVPHDTGKENESAASETIVRSRPVLPQTVGDEYRRIYESIPFNRAEYNANPSYRHDSTMEILTGNARHQTIVNHSTAPVVRPRSRTRVIPYRYNNRQRGLNYYFYFPYWNYRGIY